MTKTVNLKIAFKKKTEKTGFFGTIISSITKSKYFHVEIIIDNLWISADAPMGVTIRELEPLRHDEWDYVDLGSKVITQEAYVIIYRYIEHLRGKKYDYLAIIFSQLLHLNIHSSKRVFCSEVVTNILRLFLEEKVIKLQANEVSPKDLARLYGLEG